MTYLSEYQPAALTYNEPNNLDFNGARDALCDVSVFALGALHLMGVGGARIEEVIHNAKRKDYAND